MHLFTKPSSTSSSSSVTCDAQVQSKQRTLRALSFALTGTASLGLLLGLCVLGLAANTLRVYDDTNLGPQYFLPLWPRDTSLKPTIGFIVAGSLAVVGNIFVLGLGRVNVRFPYSPPVSSSKVTNTPETVPPQHNENCHFPPSPSSRPSRGSDRPGPALRFVPFS